MAKVTQFKSIKLNQSKTTLLYFEVGLSFIIAGFLEYVTQRLTFDKNPEDAFQTP